MAIFAVVNRKGGSGKSMLATHLASYLASLGHEVMLGDVDRQHSSRLWLGLRSPVRPRIQGWTIDDRNFARPPAGVKHVVLDTPAGFQGVGLMKVALWADGILIPTTPSLFDRKAAGECVEELRTFPRIANGKCRIACVGLRIDGRTRNGELLREWAVGQSIDYLGTIKELQLYPRCLEQGLSIFDAGQEKPAACIEEWRQVTRWIDEVLAKPEAEPAPARPPVLPRFKPAPATQPVTPGLVPLQNELAPAVVRPLRPVAARPSALRPVARPVMARPIVAAPPPAAEAAIPTFLRRLITRVF